MKAGSLFSGTGALDMAATAVLGCGPAWFVEQDPAAAKVLTHHWPDVPNHGDITAVDWGTVEPVEVLAGGFPCQDISNAGKRAGIGGQRSGLWSYFADAIRVLRPRYVLVENVSALVVRGLDRVLADLAALGFDAEWASVRASDVGAPHRRERIFLCASRDTAMLGTGGDAADAAGDGRHEGRAEPAGELGRPDAAQRGAFAPADADNAGLEGAEPTVGQELPTRRIVADPDSERLARWPEHHREPVQPQADHEPHRNDVDGLGVAVDWASYGPAISRWERLLGRVAPAPTVTGKRGGEQLNPVFVEWMMGLPAGHVSSIDGLSRNDMLRLLGNGVVVQQGAAAFRYLLPLLTEGRWAA